MKNIDKFLDWFYYWEKPLRNKVNISFSIPNPLLPFRENDVLIINSFEVIDEYKEKEYIDIIFKQAKRFHLTLYAYISVGNLKNYMALTKHKDIIKK